MYFEKKESLKLDFTKKPKKQKQDLTPFQEEDLNRLIEMAWQDRTTFDTIFELYGLTENQVKKKMRTLMKRSSFKMWRKRVQGKATKHKNKVSHKVIKFQGPW
ncbi:TIGR03643 family protein [Arcobacter cloacae]|uniref:TIGR03643 family protein n=1 Tax=Arcobacter cloacae TaxID=1054034 RepID=A0A4Q0ZJW1_9BACT|nr:TIGR03643 family protein [Arcobacter cloacae]RXJ85461.1 TIGR03643 family protein [Arcobacter cloacae]